MTRPNPACLLLTTVFAALALFAACGSAAAQSYPSSTVKIVVPNAPGATSLHETEPAKGSITIPHLMSHSSGLSYGLRDPGTAIFKAYNERKVQSR